MMASLIIFLTAAKQYYGAAMSVKYMVISGKAQK